MICLPCPLEAVSTFDRPLCQRVFPGESAFSPRTYLTYCPDVSYFQNICGSLNPQILPLTLTNDANQPHDVRIRGSTEALYSQVFSPDAIKEAAAQHRSSALKICEVLT